MSGDENDYGNVGAVGGRSAAGAGASVYVSGDLAVRATAGAQRCCEDRKARIDAAGEDQGKDHLFSGDGGFEAVWVCGLYAIDA